MWGPFAAIEVSALMKQSDNNIQGVSADDDSRQEEIHSLPSHCCSSLSDCHLLSSPMILGDRERERCTRLCWTSFRARTTNAS